MGPLGSVERLEDHVGANWWEQIFNATYLKTDADVAGDPHITKTEADFFLECTGAQPEDHILDLCCGQGRHSLELARRGFENIDGLDRSHYLVRRARTAARADNIPIRFREGDARNLPYQNDAFEHVWLVGNSFGYFQTQQDDERVLREAARVLKPGGILLIDVADGAYLRRHFEPRSWEWLDKNTFACRERSLSQDRTRLTSREMISHIRKGVVVDQFYSTRLYDRSDLETILTKVGFRDFAYHGTHEPASARAQDTGMMGHRIVVTTKIGKEWTPVRRRSPAEERHVGVIFGDPRKRDTVKPGASFDEDDFQTVAILKSALAKLPGYRFTYFDNHDALVSTLARCKPSLDLVLNLCDEGFGNDARWELHVPALLEVLGIRYTGAGPQCLAYCYDKSVVRGVARELDIPVAEGVFVDPSNETINLPFGFPVIVKPNFGDSSIGITQNSVAYNQEELLDALGIARAASGPRPVLVERFLTGADLTMGVIGNPPGATHVLPIAEEDYSEIPAGLPRICGYEAKWDPESPYSRLKSIPADLPEETERFIMESCFRLFERLECRDYARFDWRLDAAGVPHLLEVNPNPGWCWDGHLAKMCNLVGRNYTDMLGMIIGAAEQRYGMRQPEPGRVYQIQRARREATMAGD